MKIDFYINNILNYIKLPAKTQGNFLSLPLLALSPTPKPFKNTFCTSLIFDCPQHINKSSEVNQILDLTVNFLLSKRNWVFFNLVSVLTFL